jgi:hypothetical protein
MVKWEPVLPEEDHPTSHIYMMTMMIIIQAAIVKHQLHRVAVGLVLFVIAIKKRVKVALIAVALIQ